MSRYKLNHRQSFQPSCPLGGQWYICDVGSKFTGCCNNDPCSSGCKQGNLKPASFNMASYGSFPDLECNTGSFYTCRDTSPPFMGCCKSNPCKQGCPTQDLAAAYLGNNEATACQFYALGCPSASSTSAASSVSSTHSSIPSVAMHQAAASPKSSTGAIVGGAIGGVAGLVVAVILLFYCYRHAAKSRKVWNSGVDARHNQESIKSVKGPSEALLETSTHYQGLSMPSFDLLVERAEFSSSI